MEFKATTLESGVLLVKLGGRLDVEHTVTIQDEFSSQVGTKKAAVVVDLSSVDFLGSVALELLLKNAKAQHEYGGHLVICCPKSMARQVLDVSGIEQSIPVYDNLENAVQELSSRSA